MFFRVGEKLFNQLGEEIPTKKVQQPINHPLALFGGNIFGLDVFCDSTLNPNQWKILDSFDGTVLFDSEQP